MAAEGVGAVSKEARWAIDVDPTIAGLRDAADKLAAAGVPASAELTAANVALWLHIEASWLYDDDADEVEVTEPAEPVEVTG